MTFQKGHKINLGRKHSEGTLIKLREKRIGKPFEELYGKEKSEMIKKKMSEKKIGEKNPSKRPEVIIKILKSRKWYKHTKETKEKIGSWSKGKTFIELYGEKRAKLEIEKRSKSLKGKNAGDKNSSKRPVVKKKLRKAAIKYIKETRGNIYPNIRRNEKQILDELELSLGLKIERQFEVEGYFLDGYIPKLKLAIEVDEKKFHGENKTKNRDKVKQKEIEEKLNCQFIRIKDH